jgi:hypothetical protein
MRTVTGNEIDREKWSAFIDASEQGTVFQSPEIYDLFAQTAQMEPVAIGCEDGAGDGHRRKFR